MNTRKSSFPSGTIVVVSSDPDSMRFLTGVLHPHGHSLRCVGSGESVLNGARESPPDLILLDTDMPGLDCPGLCNQLKADRKTQSIPLLFLGQLDETINVADVAAWEGVDFISKPLHEFEVLTRVTQHLEFRHMQKELKETNRRLRKEIGQCKRVGNELKKYHDSLEELVEERIDQIIKTNERLQKEIAERKEVEKQLKKYQRRLEDMVKDRTAELSLSNERLQQEILQHRRTGEALKNAKLEAERANLAKSRFLANISHEIRTPMTAILGFSEILLSKVTTPELKNYIDNIHSSGETLLSLINDILDLSKIEAGRMELQAETVKIRNLLNELKQMFTHKFMDKEMELQIKVDKSVPGFLIVDKIKLRQVLVNLVENALKFSSQGTVKVTLKAMKQTVQKRSESLSSAGERRLDVIFEVQDRGIGIPEDQQELIFDSFRQQEGQQIGKYGGTGLGLTISKRLVEIMQGTISVKSRVGRGSTFRVVLPTIESRIDIEPGEDTREPDLSLIRFEPAVVLVVDDTLSARELVKGYLEDTPLSVIEAENGEEALTILENVSAPAAGGTLPDLILMDIKMPGKSGLEITKIIKSRSSLKHVPVIISTASVMKENELKLKRIGDGFLRKPFSRADLFCQLKNHLPYTVLEFESMPGEEKLKIASGEVFSPETVRRLPQLVQTLKQSFIPQWKEISETLIIDEIRSFINGVEKEVEALGRTPLSEWCSAVNRCLETFDMITLPRIFGKLPCIIAQLEEVALTQQGEP
jgi:signal transduction histidine kinase